MSAPAYLSIVLRDPDTGAEVPIGSCVLRDDGGWRVWVAMHGCSVDLTIAEPEDVSVVRAHAVSIAEHRAKDEAARVTSTAEGSKAARRREALERTLERLARLQADAQAARATTRRLT